MSESKPYLYIEINCPDTRQHRDKLKSFATFLWDDAIERGGEVGVNVDPYDWYPEDDEPGEPIEESIPLLHKKKEES